MVVEVREGGGYQMPRWTDLIKEWDEVHNTNLHPLMCTAEKLNIVCFRRRWATRLQHLNNTIATTLGLLSLMSKPKQADGRGHYLLLETRKCGCMSHLDRNLATLTFDPKIQLSSLSSSLCTPSIFKNEVPWILRVCVAYNEWKTEG